MHQSTQPADQSTHVQQTLTSIDLISIDEEALTVTVLFNSRNELWNFLSTINDAPCNTTTEQFANLLQENIETEWLTYLEDSAAAERENEFWNQYVDEIERNGQFPETTRNQRLNESDTEHNAVSASLGNDADTETDTVHLD